MVVVDLVVNRVRQPDGSVAPARELVVVDLEPVVAPGLDADGGVEAVATVLAVVTDALVRKLGRALSSVRSVDSKAWGDIQYFCQVSRNLTNRNQL